jgi:hypothetical protein
MVVPVNTKTNGSTGRIAAGARARSTAAAVVISLASFFGLSASAGAAAPPAPTPFLFSTGNPDGAMAMASRPDSPGVTEIEAADDFVLTDDTTITHATFTGLLPTGASVQDVVLEVYRVFPLDSDATRTPVVPTRVNSPSDVDLQARDANTPGDLKVVGQTLNPSFTAANSVLNGINPAPNQTTGGEGPVTGQEVKFFVTLRSPFVLPAGHYFFVPQVQIDGPATSSFYWLSAPKPIVAPGTVFPAVATDLQAWIRNSALQPDWLRVGTDIVGGNPAPAFNASFSIDNTPLFFSYGSNRIRGGVGVVLAIKVPSAGVVRVFDPLVGKPGKNGHKKAWFNAATVRTTAAGTVHVKLVPNAAGRKQLALKPTIHLKAELSFTPPGGQTSSRTEAITWHRKR